MGKGYQHGPQDLCCCRSVAVRGAHRRRARGGEFSGGEGAEYFSASVERIGAARAHLRIVEMIVISKNKPF